MIWEFSLYAYDIIFINFVKNEVRWKKKIAKMSCIAMEEKRKRRNILVRCVDEINPNKIRISLVNSTRMTRTIRYC